MTQLVSFFKIILYPFELLLSAIFSFLFSFTDSYGISLILLSFFITIITAPLYYLAEKWRNEEKAIQKRMSRDIEKIKKTFTGNKRFYQIRAAHKIYNYKSWQTFKTSFGLLVQIPFFFAAYSLLSNYKGYTGVPFFIIKDLAKPDNLLWGLNLLPFVMTFVNIAASIYYTKSLRFKENSQLFVMAIIFLLLLYKSPSALLIYWTMNNIFSLAKNIMLRNTGILPPPILSEKTSVKKEFFIKRIIKEEPNLVVLFVHLLFFSLQVYLAVRFDKQFKNIIFLLGILAIYMSIYFFLKWRFCRKLFILAGLWLLLLPLIYMLKNFAGFEYYISKTNLKILIVFILDIIIFYFFYIKFYKKIENKDKMTVIFFVTVAGYLFYLIIYQPILYYFSDPGFAGITFYPLLLLVIVVFAAAFVILTVFYFIIPVSLKMFFTRFLLSLFLCTLVYSLFLKLKTGNLDFFIFQFENIVLKMPLKQYLLDPVIIVTLWYVSKQLLVKYKNIIITVFITGSFLLFINLIMQYNKIDSDSNIDKISAEDIVAEISKAAFESHKFSKTGTNIVFFIADMFNGNYIGRLIEKNPEYKEKLSGFTWYPDCLSVSAATISSLPAMLAGYDYIPLKLINNDKTGREELKEAAKYFFPKVKAAGYKVTVTNPHIFFKEETGDDVYLEQSSRFINYWKKENGFSLRKDNSGIASLLILVSIFNSSPNNLKYSIYDDSGWLGLRNKEYIKAAREYAIKELAYINLLPEISSIDGREKVFFYIHNRLTHFPYGIDESGNVITGKNKNYSINKKQDIRDTGKDSKDLAYYSAKKTIDILLNWFDWMKANGVYDNTLIMIVSDHGNLSNDSDLNIKNVPSSHFSRSNSLLLIKDFNAAGLLNIDKSYISSADILSILESESDISFEGTKDPRLIKEKRKRIYSYFLGNTQQFTEQKTIKIKHYSVTGSIFDSNSWEEIK